MTDPRNSSYDVVVIGAGLNGLTAATILAQSGRKVLVLERRSVVGGLAAGDEFHPGYVSSGMLHDTTGLLPEVVDTLRLAEHGLRRSSAPPAVFASDVEGRGLLLHHDPTEASAELAHLGADDAERYARWRAFVDRVTPFSRRLFSQLPPNWLAEGMEDWRAMLATGFAFRRLGTSDMMELLRVGPMCVADWLDEHFESPLLKATLALPALQGCWGGPRSPGTGGALLRYLTLAGGSVEGGSQALVDALVAAAEASGVMIQTSRGVLRIDTEHNAITGVCCDDGESVRAKLVLASCDPKQTFLRLLGGAAVESTLRQSVRQYRMRGLSAKVNLALDKPLRFKGRDDLHVEFARTGQSLIHLEKDFDQAKYGCFSETPALDIHVASVSNPKSAPQGHASVSILVHGVPYELDGGWTDAKKEALGSAVVQTLGAHVKDLDGSIVAQQVLTPLDVEEQFGVTGGHLFHGEHGLDQLLVRPARQCARYATPIEGLYLCGAGSHPGGGLTCAPGFIAANTVVKNCGR